MGKAYIADKRGSGRCERDEHGRGTSVEEADRVGEVDRHNGVLVVRCDSERQRLAAHRPAVVAEVVLQRRRRHLQLVEAQHKVEHLCKLFA